MMNNYVKKSLNIGLLTTALFTVWINTEIILITDIYAQNSRDRKPNSRRAKTLSVSAFKPITDAQAAMEANDYVQATQILNELLTTRKKIKPFDRATAYQLLGYIYINQEDYQRATKAFEQTLSLNVLEEERMHELRYSMIQLYFSIEQYDKSIATLEDWLKQEIDPDAQALILAAQIYANLDKFSEAVNYSERAIRQHREKHSGQPKQDWYRLALAIYLHMKRYSAAKSLLEEMITYWPLKSEYYQQLAGVYYELGLERESFSIQTLAYKNGLLTKTNDITRLAQLYRLFNYPYKAAIILKTALANHDIEENKQNWQELGNAWLQSREWTNATQSLENAAELATDGKLWLTLCKTSIQDENWHDSKNNCVKAIEKGGLELEEGNAWQLLALARYETNEKDEAIKAFKKCSRYEATASVCQQWTMEIVKQKEKEMEDAKQMRLAEIELERRRQEQHDRMRRALREKY